jgi:hypothetical protein
MKTLNSLKTFLCMAVCFGLWSCQQIPPYQNETGAEVLKLKYKGRELPDEFTVQETDLITGEYSAVGVSIKITKLSDKVYRTEYDLVDELKHPSQQAGELVFPNGSNFNFLTFCVNEILAQRIGRKFWAFGVSKSLSQTPVFPVVRYTGLSDVDSKVYGDQFGFNDLIDWDDNQDPYREGMEPINSIDCGSIKADYIPIKAAVKR